LKKSARRVKFGYREVREKMNGKIKVYWVAILFMALVKLACGSATGSNHPSYVVTCDDVIKAH
jgi:hypothetical protein